MPSLPVPPCWKDLSETDQQPYLDRAEQELVAIHVGTGIAPKSKLVQVRARNLYNIAQKKNDG